MNHAAKIEAVRGREFRVKPAGVRTFTGGRGHAYRPVDIESRSGGMGSVTLVERVVLVERGGGGGGCGGGEHALTHRRGTSRDLYGQAGGLRLPLPPALIAGAVAFGKSLEREDLTGVLRERPLRLERVEVATAHLTWMGPWVVVWRG